MDNFIEKQFIPLLGKYMNSSDNELALEALKAARGIVNYYPVDDLIQPLTNALQHKNKDVAYLALDVLRMRTGGEKAVSLVSSEYKKLMSDVVTPFLFTCLESVSDDIVLNSMNAISGIKKDEVEEVLFDPIAKLLQHKNKQIAHLALDIIRGMGVRKEIHVFEVV
ncbi:MAG: hypothetical protein PHU34_04815 [Candidatus Methanoperedens sp.]|nr:hypothetical protein [Candidatus Methanoperedens sp.]